MLASQLFWRIYSVFAVLAVISVLLFGWIMSARQRAVLDEATFNHLRQEAVLIGELRDATGHFPADDSREVHILTMPEAEESLDREVRDAVTLGSGYAIRKANGGITMLHTAVRQGTSDAPREIITVSRPRPVEAVRAVLSDSRTWSAAAAVLGLGLGLTFLVVSRIIRPLESLTLSARQIAAGETPAVTPTHIRNEIGTLALAFESMNRQLTGRIADLQDQRRKLQHNNEQLETVLGAMVEGVIAVDDQERVLLANSAAYRLLELTPVAMVGRPIWEALRQPRIAELIRRALRGESPERLELPVTRSQTMISAAISCLPGEPCPGAVLVLHDVSELRRLEHLRREFVANVSHELKTPLSSIAAYTETLLDGAIDDPDHNREFLQRIEEQTDRLQALIVELLSLARMEAQELTAELVSVDALPIVGESVDAHRAVAESKKLQLDFAAEISTAEVWANAEGVRTLIDNLLDNAINYTPNGGAVTVRCATEGEWLQIDVTDTGVGIAREFQSRVFERFFRVDKARSRELGGTGLGLSIVKHLCQTFGGTVTLTSQIGRGSTFSVHLKRVVPGLERASGRSFP